MNEDKICKTCGERKPVTDFYLQSRTTNKRQSTCKTCVKEKARKRRQTDPKVRENDRRYRNSHKDEVNKRNRKRYQEDPDKHCRYSFEYRQNNAEQVKQTNQRWYEHNKEQVKGKSRKWYQQNSERAKQRIQKYRKKNQGRYNAIDANRRARKRSATPLWADKDKIRVLYDKARLLTISTGTSYDVDHIVPLTNNEVCGLHCEDNLRIVPSHENIKKGNSFNLNQEKQMDYSGQPNEHGLIETPFTMIKKGDNFFVEGDDTLYRATSGTALNDAGDAYILVGEDIDFNQKPFGVAKNATGYAPKFFVVPSTDDEEE